MLLLLRRLSAPPWLLGCALALRLAAATPRAGAADLECTFSVASVADARFEGLTEPASDVVITCTGGTPTPGGSPIPTVDLTATLSSDMTCRILEGEALEAVLLVDEPTPAEQVVGLNVFQGQLGSGSEDLIWRDVPFDPPGDGQKRVLRMKNVRFNAADLPTFPAQRSVSLITEATGILQGPIARALEKVRVAEVRPGLVFSVRDGAGLATTGPAALLRSHDNNSALLDDPTAAETSVPGGRSFNLTFTEGFPTAFRARVLRDVLGRIQPQAEPAGVVVTETGYFNPALGPAGGLERAGLADTGTRLLATFTNIPPGVSLFVTVAPASPTSRRFVDARLVETDPNGEDLGDDRVFVPPTSALEGGIAPVAITGGVGRAVWEVTQANATGIDELHFGVLVAYRQDAPALGTAFASGAFAPLGTVTGASRTEPVPRFRQGPENTRAFTITLGDACSVTSRDTIDGAVFDAARDDLFSFDAVAGTVLDLDVKAAAGIALALLDPGLDLVDLAPLIKTKGKRTQVKKLPLLETGTYFLSLRSVAAGASQYRLKLKGKTPREKLSLKSTRELNAPLQVFEQTFEAVAGSTLDATLKGKGVDPDLLELLDPEGQPVSLDAFLSPGLKTEKLRKLILPATGAYRLRFTGQGETGLLKLALKIKAAGKRVLGECAE